MAIDLSTFKTKKNLTEAVQDELAKFKLDEEFESELLQTLVAERHYFCSVVKMVPQKFKKTRNQKYRTQYYLWAWFPEVGWRGVSWTKCIKGYSIHDEVNASLRRVADPFVEAYRKAHPVCERCGARSSFQVDHVSPEFNEIAQAAVGMIDSDDWKRVLNCHNWLKDETFTLPDDLACVWYVRKMHDQKNRDRAKLMAVCKECHELNHRDRKNA